jgi:hypothetical protein
MNVQSLPNERRISIRTNLLGVSAKISKDGWIWEEVVAKDISDGGLGFISDKEYPIGEKLVLEGEASDAARSMDISCNVKVVFVGEAPGGKFSYGVRFMNMSKAQHTSLGIFIELLVTKYPSLLLQ